MRQNAFIPIVAQAASQYHVAPDLLASLLQHESSWNPRAVSPAGARGLGQFMPGTARQYGVNVNDPRSSIMGAAHMLADNIHRFGNPQSALAAYNAGPGAVQKYGGIPPYAETRAYVRNIMASRGGFRSLFSSNTTPAQAGPPPQGPPAARLSVRGQIVPQQDGILSGMLQPASNEVTQLPPGQETGFQDWVQKNNIQDVNDPRAHYDYRAFYADPNAQTSINPIDGRLHYSDIGKQHGHPTFSTESKYSTGPGDGGVWQGDNFHPGPGQAPFWPEMTARNQPAPGQQATQSLIDGRWYSPEESDNYLKAYMNNRGAY